jgi:hypothetical protein
MRREQILKKRDVPLIDSIGQKLADEFYDYFTTKRHSKITKNNIREMVKVVLNKFVKDGQIFDVNLKRNIADFYSAKPSKNDDYILVIFKTKNQPSMNQTMTIPVKEWLKVMNDLVS